jgi:four helix bundle protein
LIFDLRFLISPNSPWEYESMNENELKRRTKQFGLRIIKLVAALPRNITGRAISGQVVRSGTSVGANYRAACRARSKAEFIARLGIVEEEADESGYWLEMIVEGNLMKASLVRSLWIEADEITAIMTASRISAARGLPRKVPIKNQQSKI